MRREQAFGARAKREFSHQWGTNAACNGILELPILCPELTKWLFKDRFRHTFRSSFSGESGGPAEPAARRSDAVRMSRSGNTTTMRLWVAARWRRHADRHPSCLSERTVCKTNGCRINVSEMDHFQQADVIRRLAGFPAPTGRGHSSLRVRGVPGKSGRQKKSRHRQKAGAALKGRGYFPRFFGRMRPSGLRIPAATQHGRAKREEAADQRVGRGFGDLGEADFGELD